jgi:hypothetical protein
MKCHDFENVARELAYAENQNAAPNIYSEARAHVDDCELCALRLADERELNRAFRALASETNRYQSSPGTEAKLRRSFRETVAAGDYAEVSRSAAGGHAWQTYGLAAAAIVVLVFTVALVRSRFAPATPQTPQRVEARVTPENNLKARIGNAEVFTPSKKNDELPRALRRKRVRPRLQPVIQEAESGLLAEANTTSPNVREPEIATEFVALSSVPANFQDGGQIVRVELSRSAMASLGFPVNVDRFGERVKADVLLSADGFARAIRFVQ